MSGRIGPYTTRRLSRWAIATDHKLRLRGLRVGTRYRLSLSLAAWATLYGRISLARHYAEIAQDIRRRGIDHDAASQTTATYVIPPEVALGIGHMLLQAWPLAASGLLGQRSIIHFERSSASSANEYLLDLLFGNPSHKTTQRQNQGVWTLTPLLNPLPNGPAHIYDSISAGLHETGQAYGFIGLPGDDLKIASSEIENLGLDAKAPTVGVHLRTTTHDTTNPRNVDRGTYRKAVDLLLGRGYQVIELGRGVREPLALNSNYIDLAGFEHSPLLDAFVFATSKFFLGTASGPYLGPGLFGTRCLVTNIDSVAFCPDYPGAVHVPRRVIPPGPKCRFAVADAINAGYYTGDQILDSQHPYQALSPTDIASAVEWMIDNEAVDLRQIRHHITLDGDATPWSYRDPAILDPDELAN